MTAAAIRRHARQWWSPHPDPTDAIDPDVWPTHDHTLEDLLAHDHLGRNRPASEEHA